MEPVVGVVRVGVLCDVTAEAGHGGVDARRVAGRGGDFHQVADQGLRKRIGQKPTLRREAVRR